MLLSSAGFSTHCLLKITFGTSHKENAWNWSKLFLSSVGSSMILQLTACWKLFLALVTRNFFGIGKVFSLQCGFFYDSSTHCLLKITFGTGHKKNIWNWWKSFLSSVGSSMLLQLMLKINFDKGHKESDWNWRKLFLSIVGTSMPLQLMCLNLRGKGTSCCLILTRISIENNLVINQAVWNLRTIKTRLNLARSTGNKIYYFKNFKLFI